MIYHVLYISLFLTTQCEYPVFAQECARVDSRHVRKMYQKDIYPVIKLDRNVLPTECPLHPSKDRFYDQEEHKIETTKSQWKCGYCGKLFVDQFYMDRHMERYHTDKLNLNTTSCLADLCPVLGCRKNSRQKKKFKKTFGDLKRCTNDEALNLKNQCFSLSETCFHPLGEFEEKSFNKMVCDNIKCKNGVLQGGLQKPSQGYSYVFWLFRLIIISALILVILFTVCFSDIPFFVMIKNCFGFSGDNRMQKVNSLKKSNGLKGYLYENFVTLRSFLRKIFSGNKKIS